MFLKDVNACVATDVSEPQDTFSHKHTDQTTATHLLKWLISPEPQAGTHTAGIPAFSSIHFITLRKVLSSSRFRMKKNSEKKD